MKISSTNFWTDLHQAASVGRDCATIIKNGADVNAEVYAGSDGLFSLMGVGFGHAVYLMDPLKISIVKGHAHSCRSLIENGADVNRYSADGYCPLWHAINVGNAKICKLLIELGADVQKDDLLLSWAAQLGHTNICKALIKAGANVNSGPPESTPLHWAAESGHTNICKALIKAGANVNSTATDDRATPLHRAANKGHADTCQFLMDRGADVNIRDINDMSALESADDDEVVCLLVSAMASSIVIEKVKPGERARRRSL